MPDFLATPHGEGPWPGVVVIHEVFGVNDDIRAHAKRLAAHGYLALAPDLYRGKGAARCVLGAFRALAAGKGHQFDTIEAARQQLAAHAACSGRVGIIGFCMGGGFALATASRGFDVSAPNYGRIPKNLEGACPIVASYGGSDRALKGAAAQLETELSRLGVDHDVKEYPGAGHSFMSHQNPGPFGPIMRVAGVGYQEAAAEDAWERILGFFATHLAS